MKDIPEANAEGHSDSGGEDESERPWGDVWGHMSLKAAGQAAGRVSSSWESCECSFRTGNRVAGSRGGT